MSFDFDLNYTPGKQIPHADALRMMDFDDAGSGNERMCFAIKSMYFAQSHLAIRIRQQSDSGSGNEISCQIRQRTNMLRNQ